MKIVIDLELTRRQKLVAVGAFAFALAFGSSVVTADVPKTFGEKERPKPADLNANFLALDQRIKVLEDRVEHLETLRAFSYRSKNQTMPAGWNPAPATERDFNTFGDAYDPTTATFTAPADGYYRFTMGGFADTPTPGGDTRVDMGLYVNGSLQSVSGGQLSAVHSPLPMHQQIIFLDAGDKVRPHIYSPVALQFLSKEYGFWFQGEALAE
jgi:hypothetical protein